MSLKAKLGPSGLRDLPTFSQSPASPGLIENSHHFRIDRSNLGIACGEIRPMPTEVITFHRMLEGCIRNELKFWQFFTSAYAALAQHLIQKHFGSFKNDTEPLLREIVESINENDKDRKSTRLNSSHV